MNEMKFNFLDRFLFQQSGDLCYMMTNIEPAAV